MGNDFSSKPPPPSEVVPLVHRIHELYNLVHKKILIFPRFERYTLGFKVENGILEILELILIATYLSKHQKDSIVKKASDKTDYLKHLIRIAYEIKALNLNNYLQIEQELLTIGKMIGGWLKHLTTDQ